MPPSTTTCYPTLSDSNLILKIIKDSSQRARVTGLSGDDAQSIADFLSQLLHMDGALSSEDRKSLLTLLQKLVKSAQVLPQCYKLQGIRCDFSQAREGGSFADIFQGQYGEQKVCVKAVRIFQRGDNTRMLKAFVKEIVLWANLSHENILPFYGIYQGVSGRICIISPWVNPGDLSVYLQNFPHRPRLPLIVDITAGLRYLHQSDIVHGDLKSKNVLVSDDGRALIADFGISRIVVSTKLASTQLSCGTTRWMAPELLIDDGELTLQSDIWSLGCVYYEIFTRRIPFYHYASDARLSSVRLDPKAIPHRPTDESEADNISDDMWRLMENCWHNEPCSRPNCNDVHAFVTDLLGNREQSCSHYITLWKAVRGGSEVRLTCERARRILFQIRQPDHAHRPMAPEEAIWFDPSDGDGTGSIFASAFSNPFDFNPNKKSQINCLTTSQKISCNQIDELGNVKVEEIKESDILIALMGPTGSGKSSFVRALAGEDKGSGHNLSSYTGGVHAVRVRVPENGANLVFVVIPGFGDTHKSDYEILQIISDWLKKIGSKDLYLNRILYLHCVLDDRMAGTSLKNLELFEKICGPQWFHRVVLVTTMWDKLDDQDIGITHERELKDTFWKPMIVRGSSTERHDGTTDSAWGIIHHVLEMSKQQQRPPLQNETVQKGESLPTTDAGYKLYAHVDELELNKKRQNSTHTVRHQTVKPGMDQEVVGMLGVEQKEVEQARQEMKGESSKSKMTAPQKFFKSLGMKTRYRGMF